MTIHSIVLYNMAPIWYYWVSPIWSDLLRFGQIWSDLVIRVTPQSGSSFARSKILIVFFLLLMH